MPSSNGILQRPYDNPMRLARTMEQMSMSILYVANGLTRSVDVTCNFTETTHIALCATATQGQQEHQLAHQFGEPFRCPIHFFGNHSDQRQNTDSMSWRQN